MRQLSYGEISSFCSELAWLIHSGVSVSDGLALLAEEEREKDWKECLQQMAIRADDGIVLSEIMSEAACFPIYVKGIVGVGEASGRVEEALRALSRYYENKEYMNRRIQNALLYPSILVVLMLIVIVLLLTQVLPVFESVFASLGGELQGIAGGLLNVGLWLKDSLPVFGIVLALIVVLGIVYWFCIPVREKVSAVWKKFAGDKGVLRKINDAGLAQAVSMGLSSGLPLEDTMSLAAQVLEDIPGVQKRCLLCREELLKGISLAEAFKNADILPGKSCRLLSIGLQSGNGDAVMEEIARKLSEEADIALADKVAKVEPALVLVTSLLVGAILLSVMLPLMNIMQTIG